MALPSLKEQIIAELDKLTPTQKQQRVLNLVEEGCERIDWEGWD